MRRKTKDGYDYEEYLYIQKEKRFNLILGIISVLVFGFVIFAFFYANC